jgi:hypothetical protein
MQLPTTEITDLIENQPAWFEQQVLAACCKSAAFYDRFKAVLNVHPRDANARQEDFSLPQDNHIYFLLKKYRTFMAGSKGTDVMPPQFAQVTLAAMVAVGELLQEQADMAWRRLHEVMSTPVEGVMQLVHDGIPHWLSKRRVRRVAMEMANSEGWKPDELVKEINIAMEAASTAAIATCEFEFGDGWLNRQLDTQRLQTGLPELDATIGGGFGYGEFHLGIAATGAGKTVFATQLASTFAFNEHPGIFVTTEQSHFELEPRILSNLLQVPFSMLKDGFFPERMPKDVADRAEELRIRIMKKLIFLNWNQGSGKSIMKDLEPAIMAFEEKRGIKPRWVIFDWIGGGLGEMTRNDMAMKRLIYQESADKLPIIARKYNLVTIALAQANTLQAKNNPRIDSSCIAECKTMGNGASTVFGISNLQEDEDAVAGGSAPFRDKQFFYLSKARKGTGGMVPFKRKFEFQRMEKWN